MKKLFIIWALVALLFPVFAHAIRATINIASDNTVWIEKPVPPVTKVEINFGQGVLDRGDYWKQAVLNPNVVVPIETHTVSSRDGLFHIKKRRITDIGVLYDGESVNLVRGGVAFDEPEYTPYVWLWVASVILMGLGTWAFLKDDYVIIATSATFVAVLVTSATLFATTFATFATIFAALLAAATTLVVATKHAVPVKKKYFFLPSGIYGACMMASMISFMLH